MRRLRRPAGLPVLPRGRLTDRADCGQVRPIPSQSAKVSPMRAHIATLFGIPVFVDFSLIFLVYYFVGGDLESGDGGQLLIGLSVALGVLLSVLVHELAHAFAGRSFGVAADYVELYALGGVCVFSRSLPAGVWPRLVVSAVGPLSNLALWAVCQALLSVEAVGDSDFAYAILSGLAYANWFMFWFNLLPAYPLDGGKVLEAILRIDVAHATAQAIVAGFSLLTILYLIRHYASSPIWLGVMALFILMATYQEVRNTPLWRRLGGR